MRNYAEPKLEIVTLEVSDVITSSGINALYQNIAGNTEVAGHASLASYEI